MSRLQIAYLPSQDPQPEPVGFWEALDALVRVPTQRDGFTLVEFMARYEIRCETTARRKLKRLIDAGSLDTGKAIRDGRWVNVWWVK